MTLARVQDGAFGLLDEHLRRVGSQIEPAYEYAAKDTSHRLVAHANDALEEAGLGRPVSVWEHRGRPTIGVPEGHPDAGAVWEHEFGSPTSAPQATLRRTFWHLRPVAVSHFNDRFEQIALRGTMWERR